MTEEDVKALEKKLREEVARELKEAREQKAILEGLLLHPGWGMISRVLEAQIEGRKLDVVAEPLGGHRTIYRQEFWKGEISGLRLALAFPNIILEELTAVLGENLDDDSEPTEPASDTIPGSSRERDFEPDRDFPADD